MNAIFPYPICFSTSENRFESFVVFMFLVVYDYVLVPGAGSISHVFRDISQFTHYNTPHKPDSTPALKTILGWPDN